MAKNIFLLLIISFSINVYGAEEYCANSHSSYDLYNCLDTKYKSVDNELNRVYKRALSKIKNEEEVTKEKKSNWIKSLKKAQNLWINFKESDCVELMSHERGGNGAIAHKRSCLIDKTISRLNELKERYP